MSGWHQHCSIQLQNVSGSFEAEVVTVTVESREEMQMKKLMFAVVGFGLFSASVASASVGQVNGLSLALGEKSASQMNGRMLACGRPMKLKARDTSQAEVRREVRSQGATSSISAR
ncbi:MAG: hypothetical protein KGQ59_00290 [Bdellovibrionales bacterium]|nr:hypothetical protein [Bdellovibrionales bacterium]